MSKKTSHGCYKHHTSNQACGYGMYCDCNGINTNIKVNNYIQKLQNSGIECAQTPDAFNTLKHGRILTSNSVNTKNSDISKSYRFEIVNSNGVSMINRKLSNTDKIYNLDVSHLNTGLYDLILYHEYTLLATTRIVKR